MVTIAHCLEVEVGANGHASVLSKAATGRHTFNNHMNYFATYAFFYAL
jgi:hypothetical protein